MKHILITLCVVLGASQLKAQTQTPDGGNASETQSTYTGYIVNNNNLVLPSYSKNGEVSGNPYFSKDWVKGSLSTKDNQVFSQDLVFMYSKVDGRLFFKKADSTAIMQADPSSISSFTLITDKPHLFMRSDFFTTEYTGRFYEVLVMDEKKYFFLKLTTAEYEENTTGAASQVMTVTSSAGSYSDKVKYYIFKEGQLNQVNLKKKTFENILTSDKEKTEKYFKEHSGSFNEDAAINLLTEINRQIN